MGKVNRFLAERLWLQMILSILLASAVITIIYPGPSVASTIVRTAVMSVGAVGVILAVRGKEKRAAGGTTGRLVSLDAQLRKGEVPAGPTEREAMRELVGQRLHRTRHRRLALAGMTALWGGVVTLTAFTFGLRQTVGLTLLGVAFIAWLVLHGRLQIQRMHRMREALDDSARTAGRPV
ncbi:hypothetical protein [Streptomyces sp. CRN 30]|uniref:hypothetical protein n=1 Tax=Streptomyces sp. CRN 30 TaxID=3075613 RepID=UPI002A8318EE|nr:hypothetical protein [Streptomyces sp. CRN 30]